MIKEKSILLPLYFIDSENAKVLEPTELIDGLRIRAKEILHMYGDEKAKQYSHSHQVKKMNNLTKWVILPCIPHGRMTHFMSKINDVTQEELRLLGEEFKSKFSIHHLQLLAVKTGMIRRKRKCRAQDLVSLCVFLSQAIGTESLVSLCAKLTRATGINYLVKV